MCDVMHKPASDLRGDESLEYPNSLDFIEDSYLPKLDANATLTPSLDEEEDDEIGDQFHMGGGDTDHYFTCDWTTDEAEFYLRSLTLDQILDVPNDVITSSVSVDELQTVETEFTPLKLAASDKLKAKLIRLFTRRSLRDVRVTFIDFSKPYIAKVSSGDNYKQFLHIGHATDGASNNATTPTGSVGSAAEAIDELAGLTLEEQEKQREEWSTELARVEEEITTLRTVLQSKIRHASELKRKLGITVWKEMTDDVSTSLKSVKESNVYQSVESKVASAYGAVHEVPLFQKTESVVKSAAEKTTSLFSGITGGFSSKISQMKNSESFKSFEERVGSAYENVKTKVSTSRSGSISSFQEVNDQSSIPTTPTNPEKIEKS